MIGQPQQRSWWSKYDCVVCGSKAIGINFGARTCAPCKAFFRRNARRKEILALSCSSRDSSDRESSKEICTQVRYCSSCRLHRCFQVGMKEELVRTDEENQRYRQLILNNRLRRQQLHQQKQSNEISFTSQILVNKAEILEESDRVHLSNLIQTYDSYCLKLYTERRTNLFQDSLLICDEPLAKIRYHQLTTINNMSSLIAFLLSLPSIGSLSTADRVFLCQHNIRPLILLNLHELDQLCFSETSQIVYENSAMKYVCGSDLYAEFLQIKERMEQFVINDPIVTRLWLLILFLSSPLHYRQESPISDLPVERKSLIFHLQQTYVTLLWKYLCYRHNNQGANQILSNLNRVYLCVQRLSQKMNAEIRMREDLHALDDAFNRAVMIENDEFSRDS